MTDHHHSRLRRPLDVEAFIEQVLSDGLVPALPQFLGVDWELRVRQLRHLLLGFETSLCVEVSRGEGRSAYVQVQRQPGQLLVEAVSNEYLDGDQLLTSAAVAALLELGWHPPITGDSPNFSRAFRSPVNLAQVAWTIAYTFHTAYKLKPDDEWGVIPASLAELVPSEDNSPPTRETYNKGADSGEDESGDSSTESVETWESAHVWFQGTEAVAAAVIRDDGYHWCQVGRQDDLLTIAAEASAAWGHPFTPGQRHQLIANINRLRALLQFPAAHTGHRVDMPVAALSRAAKLEGTDDPAAWLLMAFNTRPRPTTSYRFPGDEPTRATGLPDHAKTRDLLHLLLADSSDPQLWGIAVALDVAEYGPSAAAHRSPRVRALALQVTTPLEVIDAAALICSDDDVQTMVASHAGARRGLIEWLVYRGRTPARLLAAQRDDLAPGALRRLIRDSDNRVRRAALANVRVTNEMLSEAVATLDIPEAAALAADDRMPFGDVFAVAALRGDPLLEVAVLRRKDCPPESLLASPHRWRLLARLDLSAQTARRVLQDFPTIVELQALARRTDLPFEELEQPWVDAYNNGDVDLVHRAPLLASPVMPLRELRAALATANELITQALLHPHCPEDTVAHYLTAMDSVIRYHALRAVEARNLEVDLTLLAAARELPTIDSEDVLESPRSAIKDLASQLLMRARLGAAPA